MALELNEENFEAEVLKSDKPVLVDFWGEGCPPCTQIAPIIAALATEVKGQAKVFKLNVADGRSVAMKYGIRSIPFLLFFKNGEVRGQIVGSNVTQQSLKEKLLSL